MPIEQVEAVAGRLEASAEAIASLVRPVGPEEAAWKPEPDRWSIIEVINHLADEEVEDFRTRVDIVLHRPEDPFPPIDPRGWVARRAYAARDLESSLDRYVAERSESLQWLRGLHGMDLDRPKPHAGVGSFSGRQLLAAWAAHDLLHLRQITKLRYDYLARESSPIELDYAGQWR